jgi:hypothetical protein
MSLDYRAKFCDFSLRLCALCVSADAFDRKERKGFAKERKVKPREHLDRLVCDNPRLYAQIYGSRNGCQATSHGQLTTNN